MKVSNLVAAVLSFSCLVQATIVHAEAVKNDVPFKKENVYGKWSKDIFADASIVQGPHKIIYVAGMAAEDPDKLPAASSGPKIDYPGDFMGQCRMAYGKIKKTLAAQGADMSGIVRTVTYVTDMRYIHDYLTCQKEALGGAPMPVHTMVNVSQLAWPGMMVEVEVTAVAPLKQ